MYHGLILITMALKNADCNTVIVILRFDVYYLINVIRLFYRRIRRKHQYKRYHKFRSAMQGWHAGSRAFCGRDDMLIHVLFVTGTTY